MNSLLLDFNAFQLAMTGLLFVWTGFVRTALGFGGAALFFIQRGEVAERRERAQVLNSLYAGHGLQCPAVKRFRLIVAPLAMVQGREAVEGTKRVGVLTAEDAVVKL